MLLFNPFSQFLLPQAQPSIGTSGSNHLQMQRNPQGSEGWVSPPIQALIMQAADETPWPRSEETAEASTLPLIDKLDRPIPVIIDLDDEPNDDDDTVDLTLRL
uniref:Uncharacterized protein n=1 Tax=Opuntia streptacantha TaxID=393608 RepID=A0A7C8ZU37_OPUST